MTLGDGHVEVPEDLGLPGPPAIALVDPRHLDGHVIAWHHVKFKSCHKIIFQLFFFYLPVGFIYWMMEIFLSFLKIKVNFFQFNSLISIVLLHNSALLFPVNVAFHKDF